MNRLVFFSSWRKDGIALLVLVASISCAHADNPLPAMAPGVLELQASPRPSPKFPADSLRAKSGGTVVVDAVFNRHGMVTGVTVLESPSSQLTAAVRSAVSEWRLPVSDKSLPKGFVVRSLLFHFDPQSGTVLHLRDPNRFRNGDTPRVSHQRVKLKPWTELGSASLGSRAVLLDVRPRAAYRRSREPESVNIPADELRQRASYELRRSNRVLIDCHPGDDAVCKEAAQALLSVGVPEVVIYER